MRHDIERYNLYIMKCIDEKGNEMKWNEAKQNEKDWNGTEENVTKWNEINEMNCDETI